MTGLKGSHVLLTGATGFLGQALLERLLSGHPDTTVSVLVRSRGPARAADRMERLLRKSVFSPWREAAGDEAARRAVGDRVEIVEGGLGTLSPAASRADVVIHSASSVSFDPPIDRAFEGNVGGAQRLYQSLLDAGADPHVVHVSTCYVGGAQRGLVTETPVAHDVDWRAEMASAATARERVEFSSRSPAALARFLRAAQRRVGKVGPQAVSAAAEEARRHWVHEQLVARGRTRAQSLGWTDAYTLTKALAERVAEELWSQGHRLSVVRPSIIESALRHPFPGWIDGFKVADPLILAYGRGQLKEFPGLPDSILDVVPVDFVVDAILAAATAPPPAGEPSYLHVASGARNPLPFHRMYENVHSYFTEHPMPSGDGPIAAPDWDFPGVVRFDRGLRRHESRVRLAEGVLSRLPATRPVRERLDRVTQRRTDLDVLRKHAELYKVYVSAEAVFDDANLHALHDRLPAAEQAEHGFDVSSIDWDDYLQRIHFPAITSLAHAYSFRARDERDRKTELKPGDDVLAVFDLEGTVLAANLVEQYLWLRAADRAAALWPREVLRMATTFPRYVAAERRDRSEFIRTFLRLYEGMPVAGIRRHVSGGGVGRRLRAHLLADALQRAQDHRRAGHRTVLVTGAIDLFAEVAAPYFDEVVASRMQERDGVLTGFLAAPPLVGESRAAWLRHYADVHGFALERAYGYGDSYADTSWLGLVGHPAAVNPDSALYRHARAKRWSIMEWTRTGPVPALAGEPGA